MATSKEAFTKREKKKSAEANDLYKWLRLGLTGSYNIKNRLHPALTMPRCLIKGPEAGKTYFLKKTPST